MFFEYLKENPVLAAILIVCAATIAVVTVILLVRRAGTKNTPSPSEPKRSDTIRQEPEFFAAPPSAPSENPSEQQPKPIEENPENLTERKQAAETATPEQTEAAGMPEQEEITPDEPEEIINPEPAPIDVTEIEETETETEAKSEEPAEEETAAGKTPGEDEEPEEGVKREKNKLEEGYMYLDDLKNAPVEEENDFYDEEDEADQIAKYSGKWIICRVVTANSKSAEVIRAGESDEETFFFELRASNGEKLLTSEEYTTYNGALSGIETHKANIARGNFKIVLSKQGDYMFKLLSGKNMLLCLGEHYATKARCESAIESTKRFAKTAIVDENVQDLVITPPGEIDADEANEKLPDDVKGKWIIRAHTAEDGEQVFYFELFASNGEKLLSSEEYLTYIGAINGIGTHKANIARGNFRISLAKSGDYIYKLLNGNGQLLCFGEHYKTRKRCENAIEWVKVFAKNSPILTDAEIVHQNA